MTSFPRTASLLIARTSLALVVLSFAVFATWTTGDLLGQAPAQKKPRVEEEEETPRSKPKRKVIQVEEEEDPKAKSTPKRPSGSVGSGDLNQLAEQAAHPAVKELFHSLAVPHDWVLFKRTPGVTISGEQTQHEEKIEPTPLYLGNEPSRYRRERLRFTPLTRDWQRGKPFDPIVDHLELVRPYEEIAQAKVRQFLEGKYDQGNPDAPGYLSRYDMLVAAEQALSAVLRWHESARQTGKRSGPEWADIEKKLRKQLLDEVLLEQMKVLAQAKDWDRVLELTRRLAITYTDANERQRIFRPVADLIRNALKDPTGSETKRQLARKRLHDLEMEFPGNSAFQPISDTLQAEAQGLLNAAKELASDKNDKKKLQRAQELLQQAKETWPELPELRAFEIELSTDHPILRVGVRGRPPRYLSPAWACTDNERRAVEMLFESLVKQVPDEAGGFRYRPGLAESLPKVVPLGRQFQLPRNAFWSDGRPLNSTDIDFSLRSLQNGTGVGRSRVWGDLLVAAERKKDPFQVTLRMTQGFLDPLALMTFKILPRELPVNSQAFAKDPVTSGPFRLDRSRQSDQNRECLFFMANPSYGQRRTKRNAPRIQEVRFYTYTNAVEELSAGKLDLVLDLTAQEAQALLEKQNMDRLPIVVPKPSSAVPNRRIYFLAINNRKLPDANLRRALAFAINREVLLDKHFRAALKVPAHRALNGPFPVGSWACKPTVSDRPNKKNLDLFDADAAKNLSVGAVKPDGLKLKYPQDNPALDEAMKELCNQVKELTGVVLEPAPCDPYQLREDVEQMQDYDLAYYHYDFPDDSYWLAPLLGPLRRTDGSNLFKFTHAKITELLMGTKSYRDFAVVRQYQWTIHELLNKEMPFIPLWQLDPLLAYRREVQPAGLDPLLVFSNIEEWRLQHR